MSRTPSPDPVTAHLRALREDPQSVNPPGWHADFADGPWPVKAYQGGHRSPPDGSLARVLHRAVAVTAVRGPGTTLRRAVPSGGAMYPTEVYVVAPHTGRCWHVDPYRGDLLALPGTGPTARLRAGLRLGEHDPLPPVLLMLTSRFWKNFYKYGTFSFRLGAVDAGVLLGRLRRLATAEYGTAQPVTTFADEVLNEYLGLDGDQESVYAVLGCGRHPGDAPDPPAGPVTTAPPVLERSRRIKRTPVFDLLHTAARTGAPEHPTTGPAPAGDPPGAAAILLPPALPVDLLDDDTIVRRHSNGRHFTGAPATAAQLATVLRTTADQSDATAGLPGTDRYVAVHRVTGIPAGWYAHRHDRLVPVGRGHDPGLGPYLQQALFGDTVNAELAAFTVHIVAAPHDGHRSARAYRTQQLAVGVALEAVTLTATAVGLGNHPFLGFDAPAIDAAYGLDAHTAGAQAQICAGPVRPGPEWEVTVRPR
ncbi:hypothetical protein [Actinoplanes sp. NPDC051494]|uniref:hypothetical protein n=1 Tax=Actinoplanes sp. NPDC051494 TaxID=3363907 RepID=UPI0037AACB67